MGGFYQMKPSFWNKTTVVPQDIQGRIYFFLPIYFASFIYLGKLVRSDFFVGEINIWLSAFFWLGPAICVVIPFLVYLIGLSIHLFRFHRHISLVLVLICGYLFARFFPVPPTPEEILFSWQKPKYEEIVELARTRQLQHDDTCQQPNQFTPPSGYIQWSDECIHVERQYGMLVEFAPRNFERPLIYVENPEGDISVFSICNGVNGRERIHEGFVFKQLNEHWFICKRLLDS
jgi:hypothetical protein